jgi:DNA-binding IclR family transcriptional regulator
LRIEAKAVRFAPVTSDNKKSSKPGMTGHYSAPALEKGMDVVQALADAETGLTISEISERLKRGMSELFRIIVVMEKRGWLIKDPKTSRYNVSYQLLLLAHRGTPAHSLTESAAPVMQDLSTRIDQSCHLVIRSGNQALVIFRQENQRRYANLSVRMGGVLDLITSCSGLMLLAHMEDGARDALIGALPKSKLSRAKIDSEMKQMRSRGYAVRRSPMTEGVTDISAPVRGFDGRVVAALTVPYLHVIDGSLPTSVDQARRLVEQSARQISLTLGWAG